MPELPDIVVYVERVRALAASQPLTGIRLANPFILRTVDPPPDTFSGRLLLDVTRIGKRIVLCFEGEQYALIHLMIAGRLHWRPVGSPERKTDILAFHFASGTLTMTEAGTKHRASLHLVSGKDQLAVFDRGGVDLFSATPDTLGLELRRENRTLKRALTDPAIVDGVGNAYSDEILHRARMSPFALTRSLSDAEVERLLHASVDVLREWIDRLRKESGPTLPENVTAFRPEMAVHGKYGKPCPVCGAPIQRVVYAENEANYCPVCQTGGRVLADRGLSRLLKDDWPRSLEDLERLKSGPRE